VCAHAHGLIFFLITFNNEVKNEEQTLAEIGVNNNDYITLKMEKIYKFESIAGDSDFQKELEDYTLPVDSPQDRQKPCSINVFPGPYKSPPIKLQAFSKDTVNIYIYDINGQIMHQRRIILEPKVNEIEVPEFLTGMYGVKIFYKTNICWQRIYFY